MEQSVKRMGLVNWIVLLAAAGGCCWSASIVASVAGLMGAILAALGVLVALLSYCQMSLEAREELERLELEELSKTRGGASIFAASQDDTFPARRSREQFERLFHSGFDGALLGLPGGGGLLWLETRRHGYRHRERAGHAGDGVAGVDGADTLFAGQVFQRAGAFPKAAAAAPGAAYLLLSAYAFSPWAATVGRAWRVREGGFHRGACVVRGGGFDCAGDAGGPGFRDLPGAGKGKDSRLLYESRLVGLLGQPEAIITTAAHAWIINLGSRCRRRGFIAFWNGRWPGWSWRNGAFWSSPLAWWSLSRAKRLAGTERRPVRTGSPRAGTEFQTAVAD